MQIYSISSYEQLQGVVIQSVGWLQILHFFTRKLDVLGQILWNDLCTRECPMSTTEHLFSWSPIMTIIPQVLLAM